MGKKGNVIFFWLSQKILPTIRILQLIVISSYYSNIFLGETHGQCLPVLWTIQKEEVLNRPSNVFIWKYLPSIYTEYISSSKAQCFLSYGSICRISRRKIYFHWEPNVSFHTKVFAKRFQDTHFLLRGTGLEIIMRPLEIRSKLNMFWLFKLG